MVVSDQPRLPQPNGAAGSSGVGGGVPRPVKRQKQEKVPQRGLGVAELERILRDQQRGVSAATPATAQVPMPVPVPVQAVAADVSWVCQNSSSSRRERPLSMASGSPSTSGSINIQMEPPSNQMNAGNSGSYTIPPPWLEEERIYGMKRPWTLPVVHGPNGPSILSRVPLISRIELPHPNQVHEASIRGNMNRNVVVASGCGESDNKNVKEDTGWIVDGRFLTLGPSTPLILPTAHMIPKLKPPVVTTTPPINRELPETGTWQFVYGFNENSAWKPLQTPFYEFLPMVPSRREETNAREQEKQEDGEIDLSLKL